MTAQGLLHTKPPKIDLQELPSIAEFIQVHVSKLEKSQFGMQKTADLLHHIESSEVELLVTKLNHDIDQFKNFLRRCKTLLLCLVRDIIPDPGLQGIPDLVGDSAGHQNLGDCV